MGFGDLVNEFANSEEGQNLKDEALNKAGDAANNLTGGQFQDQINQGRDAVSGAFGGQQQDDQSQGGGYQAQDDQQQGEQDQY